MPGTGSIGINTVALALQTLMVSGKGEQYSQCSGKDILVWGPLGWIERLLYCCICLPQQWTMQGSNFGTLPFYFWGLFQNSARSLEEVTFVSQSSEIAPAGCPVIQFSSDTNCQSWSRPHKLRAQSHKTPPLHMPATVGLLRLLTLLPT